MQGLTINSNEYIFTQSFFNYLTAMSNNLSESTKHAIVHPTKITPLGITLHKSKQTWIISLKSNAWEMPLTRETL